MARAGTAKSASSMNCSPTMTERGVAVPRLPPRSIEAPQSKDTMSPGPARSLGDAWTLNVVDRDTHRRRIAGSQEVRCARKSAVNPSTHLVQLPSRISRANSRSIIRMNATTSPASLAELDGLELDVRHRLLRHRVQDREGTAPSPHRWCHASVTTAEQVLVHVIAVAAGSVCWW